MSKGTVLICEDEFVVALDLQMMIEDFGFDTTGPYASVEEAIGTLPGNLPDVAVLDVSLKDGEVFPLADKLQEQGVPLIFHSGHVYDHEIFERYPGAACCQKPVNMALLQDALMERTAVRVAS